MSQVVAHRDGRRFDGQPSLSGHCGHEAIFGARRSVANDPRLPFADRQLWNAAGAQSAYPALMLAARTTLPHFSVSVAMSMPKSAGDPRSAVPPNSANRALILGSTSAALISLLSLSMIAEGVFFGTPTPNHALAS